MKQVNKHLLIGASLVVSLGVILTGVAYALHLGPWDNRPEPLDLGPVIARVNGSPIHLEEAAARVDGLSTVHGEISDALGKDWPEQILQSLVDDQILIQQAHEMEIEVSEADIASYVERIRGMIGEEQSFEAWLADQHMTLPELERRVELQIIGARVYITVTEDAKVSGEEVRDYYREHRAEFEEADGSIPSLLEVRSTIHEGMLKDEQDAAYAAWLDGVRQDAEVVVVMDDWWRDL